jgi:hypothetical protein
MTLEGDQRGVGKMAKQNEQEKHSWKEKYDHVFSCYCSLWNSALNFIAKNFGEEALDRYLQESMGKEVLGESTFSELRGGDDTQTFLKHYLGHHLMIGGEVKVVKAEEDEIIVDLVKCGSKSMLVKNLGKNAGCYCRHCEIIPIWEQLGWESEVDKSQASCIEGENIGCRRIFRRKK